MNTYDPRPPFSFPHPPYKRNFLTNKTRLLGFFSLMALLTAIPMTMYLVSQRQDIRQRAAEYAANSCNNGNFSCIRYKCQQGNFSCAFCVAPWIQPLVQNGSVPDPWFGRNQWDGVPRTCDIPTAPPIPTATSAPTATPVPPLPTATTAPTAVPPTITTAPTAVPPTATSVPPSPTATQTPQPTVTSAITPTSPPIDTILSLNLLLHGIGIGGDNVSADAVGNTNPLRPSRNVTLDVLSETGQVVMTKTATVLYSNSGDSAGTFRGTVNLGSSFTTGTYSIRMKPQYFLRRQSSLISIQAGQTNIVPRLSFISGDINDDNVINVLDYNILINCYSDLSPAKACTDTLKAQADINDDGNVDQYDYILFIRELSVQAGD